MAKTKRMIPASKRVAGAKMIVSAYKRKHGREYVHITVERMRDVKQYERRSCGVQSGMGVLEFLAVLFKANEQLPMHKRMTDLAMTKKFLAEFPTSKVAKGMIDGRLTVNHFRGQYNRGKLTASKRDVIVLPNVPSQRYGEFDVNGKPTMMVVDNRTGRPLAEMEQRRLKRTKAGRRILSGKGN